MNKLIVILCTVFALTACTLKSQDSESVRKAEIATKMTEWCEKKPILAEETRITVEVLLERAGTKDCKKAGEILSNLTQLHLGKSNISDLAPISDLTNLMTLN